MIRPQVRHEEVPARVLGHHQRDCRVFTEK